MMLLRFASMVVLALWVGGLAVLGGVAAPTIFAALTAHDPATGRELGGLVFGAVFERFQYVSWGLAALLLALLGARAALGPRPRRFGLRMWSVTGMLAMSLIGGLYIAPRINAIRSAANGAVAALPDHAPIKIEFGRLHGAANGMMLLTLVFGLGLLWAEAREQA